MIPLPSLFSYSSFKSAGSIVMHLSFLMLVILHSSPGLPFFSSSFFSFSLFFPFSPCPANNLEMFLNLLKEEISISVISRLHFHFHYIDICSYVFFSICMRFNFIFFIVVTSCGYRGHWCTVFHLV